MLFHIKSFKGMFGLNWLDFNKIEYYRIHFNIIEFNKINLCLNSFI